MEDVLEVYTRPYDPRFPQVCMDESAKQLLQDKRESLPGQKGLPERVDYTFESGGMCKIFLACEPLTGQRQVKPGAEHWIQLVLRQNPLLVSILCPGDDSEQ